MTLFYLQRELIPPQEASVDIYKASQKAYNDALHHKEYQILSDLWKNCMNSYLTVRKLLGHPNTCKLLNGWHPLMEKKNMMLLTLEWRKNNTPPPKKVPRPAPVASSRNSNVKSRHRLMTRAKGRHQPQSLTARDTQFQRFSRMPWKMYFRWPEPDGIKEEGGSQIMIPEMISELFASISELYEAINDMKKHLSDKSETI
ncbi:hypothetical protein O181_080374 [Austropuccinia psidii MF-1]|uniref:Uncharacterized protein n=1 Tax=Austropuccinia psidii MF-1 TaxID=1389203 RepID=A0A9Q3FKA0_9BASI|nr:hypothetical protein [Austropuccinia psidii MF-1]